MLEKMPIIHALSVHALNDPSDPFLCFWLDLLQRQFPLDEQVSAGSIVKMVQEKKKGEAKGTELWVALSPNNNEPVGMTWFDTEGQAAALWYIAVAPGQEGHGYGTALMQAIADKVFGEADCDLMAMEVENTASHGRHRSPENETHQKEQIRKRNSFYINRHRAWQLTGIKYYQQAGFSDPIPMDILIIFHPGRPTPTAETAFALCQEIFGKSLAQDGVLGITREIAA